MVGGLNRILPLVDQAVVSGGNALLQILLVRLLGINDYGLLAFIMIFVLGAVALNQSLIVLPFQILYNNDKDKEEIIDVNSLQFNLMIFFSGTVILLCVLNEWLDFMDRNLLLAGGFYGLGYLTHDFIRKRLFVQERYKKVLILDIGVMLGSLITVFLLYFYELDLTLVLLLLGLSYSLFCFMFFGSFKLLNFDLMLFKKYWAHAKWLCASTVTQWFSGNIILSTAGIVLGPWVLGVVRMGQTINGVLGVMFQLMESYFPSKIATVYSKEGFISFKKYLWDIGAKSSVFTLVIAVLLILLREPLMEIVYGIDSVEHAHIMYWFGSLLVVNVLNIVMRFYIRTLNMNRIIFESYLFLAGISLLSANFIVSGWGLSGVCFGLVMNQLLSLIWFVMRVSTSKSVTNSFS